MNAETIQDITEAEFLELVRKICVVDYKTEYQHTQAVMTFERLGEPDADDSPEGIVKEVKAWRAANGKAGFKSASD
jgi:hypothetical protein